MRDASTAKLEFAAGAKSSGRRRRGVLAARPRLARSGCLIRCTRGRAKIEAARHRRTGGENIAMHPSTRLVREQADFRRPRKSTGGSAWDRHHHRRFAHVKTSDHDPRSPRFGPDIHRLHPPAIGQEFGSRKGMAHRVHGRFRWRMAGRVLEIERAPSAPAQGQARQHRARMH